MTYNKKQMQPLIDKYAINPETNKLFINVMEMFDNQPNYQIWAVKMLFSKTISTEELENIHNWISKNQTMVKLLDKKNIVSYSTKQSITQLFKEMKGLDVLSLVKNSISHFNTEQRKMLTEAILGKEHTALSAYSDKTLNAWAEIFKKFNRLPFDRKNKFYSNCSRLKTSDSLLQAIKTSIEETYNWNKEDFLAFMANNASDCEVVHDNGPYVIIHVPSFNSSKLLCGDGRTKWCITQQDSYFRQYVSDHSNRNQYFMFDFSRKESDEFAHIGFTMENGRSFYCAQTCGNSDMRGGFSQNGERLSIQQALEKANAKMSIFMRLNPLVNYKWELESILNYIKKSPNDYAIAYEGNGRLIINILNSNAVKNLCGHTLITSSYYVDNDNKVYVFIDTNLKHNDEKSLLFMTYKKDTYGSLSLKKIVDPFNNDVTKSGYLSKIGITTDAYLNREAIDPKILLHKLIDENDEIGAIRLIEKEGKDFNVNFEFNNRIPIVSAINNKMYSLFDKIINHPKLDSTVQDGFGETLLETLLYLYGSNEISAAKEEEEAMKRMIISILKSETYDFNIQDLNSNTAINIACEFPKMVWVVKALASRKDVNINIINDFECAALGTCIRAKNIKALEIIGQRPDVEVRDEDKKLAKSYGIKLKDYIKPNEEIFGSVKFDDDLAKETVNASELEMALASAI